MLNKIVVVVVLIINTQMVWVESDC